MSTHQHQCPYLESLRKEYLTDIYAADPTRNTLFRRLFNEALCETALNDKAKVQLEMLTTSLLGKVTRTAEDATPMGLYDAIVFGERNLEFLQAGFGFAVDNLIVGSPRYSIRIERVRTQSRAGISFWLGKDANQQALNRACGTLGLSPSPSGYINLDGREYEGLLHRVLHEGIHTDESLLSIVANGELKAITVKVYFKEPGRSLLHSVCIIPFISKATRESNNLIAEFISTEGLSYNDIFSYNFFVLNTPDDPLQVLYLAIFNEYIGLMRKIGYSSDLQLGDIFIQTDDYLTSSRVSNECNNGITHVNRIPVYSQKQFSIVNLGNIDIISRMILLQSLVDAQYDRTMQNTIEVYRDSVQKWNCHIDEWRDMAKRISQLPRLQNSVVSAIQKLSNEYCTKDHTAYTKDYPGVLTNSIACLYEDLKTIAILFADDETEGLDSSLTAVLEEMRGLHCIKPWNKRNKIKQQQGIVRKIINYASSIYTDIVDRILNSHDEKEPSTELSSEIGIQHHESLYRLKRLLSREIIESVSSINTVRYRTLNENDVSMESVSPVATAPSVPDDQHES